METISFNKQCYLVAGKPTYLYSGEFHYFRVPKADWRIRMRLFKDVGGNCLATYVPWLLHEPQEDRFQFGGEDYLDLEGFLQTAHQEGLYVIARPGPYQYSELMYSGLPGWLCDNYPEILSRDYKGNYHSSYSISYVHPAFLKKARAWFYTVCPILARYTITQGGPIALVQIDNEMAGIHTWFGGLDYNPVAMGFGQEKGRFPRYLRNKYKTIQSVNRAYDLDYYSFKDVPPPDPQGTGNQYDLRRRKDYFEFYLSTIAEYASRLTIWMRRLGIDTPIVHNSANPNMNPLFLETVNALGEEFLLGSDHYYNLSQRWEQNNPTPQYARKVFSSLEMLRLMGYPPTVFELPGGSCADWPPITPHDAAACYLTNLALGMKGHNFYIFTGGPNPPGAGTTTDIYDYGASVSASGEIRPLYKVQQDLGKLLETYPWLIQAERETDCRIGMDWDMSRSNYYWNDTPFMPLSLPQAWEFLQGGPLSTSLCANLSPVFCDLDQDEWTTSTETPVIIVSSSSMSAGKQKRIIHFLRSGGKVLLMPVLPEYDENLQPCDLLKQFLGAPSIRSANKALTRLTVSGVVNISNNGEVYFSTTEPEGASVLGIDERTNQIVCWSLPIQQGGEAIYLGFRWDHAMHEHEHMLRNLLIRLGCSPKVHCTNSNIWTSLRSYENRSMLFVMNLFTSPMEASLQCKPSWAQEWIDIGIQIMPAMSVRWFEINER